MKKAYLVLGNGMIFEGIRFGAEMDSVGEIVFSTGMCGYIETLTDPSYYGQIVLQTFPLVGNYGVIEADFEGKCMLKGYIVREWCEMPSNFRAQYNLNTFLKQQGITGLYGIDTREVTRIIRDHGVMNAKICDQLPSDMSEISDYHIDDAVKSVTISEPKFYLAKESKYLVVLVDYGAKRNIIRELNKRGCSVMAVPANTSAEKILAYHPDGIMLSNGPGDPAENIECIYQIQKLLGKKPIFGICLGHQLLALANGAKTKKMKYGHRGVNQPVRDLEGMRTYITSQNHGYAVISNTLPVGAKEIFVNANDGTCEGISYAGKKAFSVQFHPEACAGPHDTAFLFDRMICMMEEEKYAAL